MRSSSVANAAARTRPVGHLLAERFVVAEYQRGYKWTADEVCQFLDDVHEFRPGDDGDFYCLQPLVVSRRAGDGEWELIDGQQRMTTIYLVLAFLEHSSYAIRYLTRHGSEAFLKSMRQPAFAAAPNFTEDNIDNYHFAAAYEAVAGWFGSSGAVKNDFRDKLLQHVRVIWYEVEDPDHKRIFLHLNSGKIALTPAERIKALFLAECQFDGMAEEVWTQRLELAQEWDRIEYALREEPFWLFLHDQVGWKDDGTRIDFLFRLLPGLSADRSDDLAVYDHYAQLARKSELNGKSALNVAAEWTRLKACFLTLREWFEDRETYHDAGFLIACRHRVADLYADADGMTRSQFKTHIRQLIRKRLAGCQLKELSYEEDRRAVNDVLLLFNLRLLQNEHARYPFDRHKREAWSLEHVHARNLHEKDLDADWAQRALWVQPQLASLKTVDADELAADLARSLEPGDASPDAVKDARAQLTQRIDLLLPEHAEDEVNRLGNLALLSGPLNSALGNKPFDEKREIVIEWDKQGAFIPVATRNVFLKYYGGDLEFMNRWTLTDRVAYVEEIGRVLGGDLPTQT